MSPDAPQFPEYGEGGDFIGAKRMRRAFRWSVAALALFTGMLWFSEHFLRYEQADRLYISALTLPPESGRNFLRQIEVQYDQRKENPPSRYIQALAEREEDDLVLPTYRRAFQLDPNNAALAIRYGCRLFRDGDAATARLRLREAAESNPKNILPMYLEAAVIPWVNETSQDWGTSFAIITRANAVGERVVFPRPLWSAALPERGYGYSNLRRKTVDECSEPFYRFVDELNARLADTMLTDDASEWGPRLQALATMGKRVASGALATEKGVTTIAGGSPQAYAGLYVVRRAVQLLKRIPKEKRSATDEELIKQGLQVDNALKLISDFENQRERTIAADRTAYRLPIVAIRDTVGLLLVFYLMVHIVCKISRVQASHHTIHHGQSGRIAFLIWSALVLAQLTVMSLLREASIGSNFVHTGLVDIWWVVALAAILFSLVYPRFVLLAPKQLLRMRSNADPSNNLLRIARDWYRAVYLSLMRRYLGVQFGMFLGGTCIWVIGFRLATGLYAWQFELLATDLSLEEAEAVRNALALVM